ncbi:hypothetical protein VP01_60g3 [Puccinia sorghi]|uniref:Uncharacterized protein n=1 Tax=Puccinia sorghi TaxID=27349 RepID=A0A0L6UH29_9BASI|nr:hypothetical protein VP01_60g3 [Puccinia sorghi]
MFKLMKMESNPCWCSRSSQGSKQDLEKEVNHMISKTAQQTQPTPGLSNTSAAAKKRGRSPNNSGAPGSSLLNKILRMHLLHRGGRLGAVHIQALIGCNVSPSCMAVQEGDTMHWMWCEFFWQPYLSRCMSCDFQRYTTLPHGLQLTSKLMVPPHSIQSNITDDSTTFQLGLPKHEAHLAHADFISSSCKPGRVMTTSSSAEASTQPHVLLMMFAFDQTMAQLTWYFARGTEPTPPLAKSINTAQSLDFHPLNISMTDQAIPAPATTNVSEATNPKTMANNNATTPPPCQLFSIHDKNPSNKFSMSIKVQGKETASMQQRLPLPKSVHSHSSHLNSMLDSDYLSSHSLGRKRCHPGLQRPQDSDPSWNNPITDHFQTHSVLLLQKKQVKTTHKVQKEPAQTQGPPPFFNLPTDTTIDKTVPASNNPQLPNASFNPPKNCLATTGKT